MATKTTTEKTTKKESSNNALDSVLEQYEKSKQGNNSSSFKMSQEERLQKYFAPILPNGKNSGQKKIRILPTNDGTSPFKEVWFHEVYVDGKWTKLYDPGKNDNERSPLNEVYEDLMQTGKESDKELAKSYRSRKFYIVKVIDRDAEGEGVKFWRFKHNYKNEGILDKIIPIWRNKGDITDSDNGRDLIIEMVKAKANNGKDYTAIQTIMHDDASKLSEDHETAKEWLDNSLTWSDVYSKKNVDYLDAIARGETPKWSMDLGRYVYGTETESHEEIGGAKKTNYVDPQANEEPSDDLPF